MIPSLSGALGLWFLVGQLLPVALPAGDADATVCCKDGTVIVDLKECCKGGIGRADLKGCCRGGTPMVICLSEGQVGPRVAALQGSTAVVGGSPLICVAQADQDMDELKVVVREPSSRWLGVLLTPVPAPLAAHIGSDGLMIGNVVKGSPADQAGLERYDVLLTFEGESLDDSQTLRDAIERVQAGDSAEVVYIRGGQQHQLSVTPAKRSPAAEQEYKYEEGEEEFIDQTLMLRGHRLRPGPGGAWIFEELGPLHNFQDVLKNLQELHIEDLDFDPEDFRIDLDVGGDPFDCMILKGSEGDADVRVELRVEVDDDGNVTQLRRDADGKIHVKHVDPDGNETTATYDNAEELKEADPEAFELFGHVSGGGRGTVIHKRPPTKELRRLRDTFQFETQEKLRDALEQAQQAYREAQKAGEDAARKHRATGQARRRVMPEGEAAEMVTVELNDDGGIRVTTRRGGARTIYEFDNKDDFKRSEPELYERFKNLFD